MHQMVYRVQVVDYKRIKLTLDGVSETPLDSENVHCDKNEQICRSAHARKAAHIRKIWFWLSQGNVPRPRRSR